MGGFYYSQFCRGILPLFIMAFPPVTRGETQGKAGAGSVCSNVSRCVFKAMAFGAKPFSALPVRWISHPLGGGRQSPFKGYVSAPTCTSAKNWAASSDMGPAQEQGLVGAVHKSTSLCTS